VVTFLSQLLYSWERTPVLTEYETGANLVGPRAGLDIVTKSISCLFTIQTVDHPACSMVTILTALPAPFHSLRERKCKVLSKYSNAILSQDGTPPPVPPQIRAVTYKCIPTFIHCGPEEPCPCLIYILFHVLSVIEILRP